MASDMFPNAPKHKQATPEVHHVVDLTHFKIQITHVYDGHKVTVHIVRKGKGEEGKGYWYGPSGHKNKCTWTDVGMGTDIAMFPDGGTSRYIFKNFNFLRPSGTGKAYSSPEDNAGIEIGWNILSHNTIHKKNHR